MNRSSSLFLCPTGQYQSSNKEDMFYDQREFDIRCEWGRVGISQLVPDSDAIVIVDVLSFSTCVDIVVSNGATGKSFSGDVDIAAMLNQSKCVPVLQNGAYRAA